MRYGATGLSVLTIMITWLWCIRLLGGLGKTGKRLFNWHPVVMSIAVLGFMTHGLLMWVFGDTSDITEDDPPEKVFAEEDRMKPSWRYLHGSLMLIALIGSVAGITVAAVAHDQTGKPQFYTTHSWLGLCVVAGMVLNGMAGAFGHVISVHSGRSSRSPRFPHRTVGYFVYGLAIVAMQTGISSLQQSAIASGNGPWSPASVMGLIVGALSLAAMSMTAAASFATRQHVRALRTAHQTLWQNQTCGSPASRTGGDYDVVTQRDIAAAL